jgi:NAD(P)H dehydrogenase (quinone)
MSLVVTGATGHLGRLVVETLLARGVPGGEIVAAGRTVAKLTDLAERGVQIRPLELSDPDSVRSAFVGTDKVLLISGTELGQRVAQHVNAIRAAEEAGVALLAYTSVANADHTGMLLAADHQATEQALRESSVPFTLLRNGWYLENYIPQIPTYLEYGAVLGSAGAGRVSAAARADYAEAAASVLLDDAHIGQTYELGGDDAFTLTELAGEVSAAADTPVAYKDLPVEEYTNVLSAAGLPEEYAAVLADSDLGIARGDLLVSTGDLARLIGRSTTPMREAVRAAVANLVRD